MDVPGSTEKLEKFILAASKLPVLPAATVRLLKELDSPNGSPRDIARIVEAEPALAIRLLKLANSSFYGHRGSIAKIDKAVAILGSRTIRSLALTVWTHALNSQRRTPEEMALLSPLLAHGLATGIAARLLVERMNTALSEDAFIAGLLHDIGRVALVAEMGADYKLRILEPATVDNTLLHVQELAVLGFDHRGLGSALMTSWALPEFISRIAEKHHDIITDPGNQLIVAAVALADHLATRLGFNLGREIARAEPPGHAEFFGLAEAVQLSEFLETCMRWFRLMSEALIRERSH